MSANPKPDPKSNTQPNTDPSNPHRADSVELSQADKAKQLRLACRSHIVIPARLASSRLQQKLLLRETGKSVLHHTHEAACSATLPLGITVAVDSEELAEEVACFGGKCIRTDPQLPSGTDRVVVAAKQLSGIDIIVNVQGDEPEIDGAAIDQVIELLQSDPSADVATLATPIREKEKVFDPACVKVVLSHDGTAHYFSRSPIPFPREWNEAFLQQDPPLYLQHIGLYAYRHDFLMRLQELQPSPLEETEKLEQLRFLQSGKRIVVGLVSDAPKGIDTQEDYRAFVARILARSASE
ncbi:MAG: 3-deoxy-manno-octulosonate cytidylyltransferase [Planctomycetota bacterium]